jgi:trimethylamine--corrinoid protein Co-methyltransferase
MKSIHAQIEVLSQDDLDQIHRATLEVLGSVGCRLPHRRILARLEQEGLEVDHASSTVKLPPAFMEKVMRTVGGAQSITGADRFARPLPPGGKVSLHPGNQATIVDYPSLARRQGTTEDVLKGLLLCNELPYIWEAMPLVTPADVPACMGDLYGYYLCALYSRKPYRMYILSPESARQVVRIAGIVAGENPARISYLLEPNGALSYDELSLEMALIFAEAGHSFELAPMAMAGLDAPATLAGTLVMQNAYNWIGNLLAYLWHVPATWVGSAHTMDLRSSLCSFG